ncbi:GIY-YIG nuclease family protein [Planococcus sp. 4-30]|uniref:GIY-YIG nuclease family protein n=1 Tax=Planococcus sp. 4-30 TaxID=2874583 RepID=UPI001CBCF126
MKRLVSKQYIYLFKNAHKELLYVGIAEDVQRRVKEHKNDKIWFEEIFYIELAGILGDRFTC